MPAPSFVGAGAAVTSGAVPLPDGWQPGDLALLVYETQHADSGLDSWSPAGWTLVLRQSTGGCGVTGNTTSTKVTVFYRRLQAGDVGPTLPAPQNHVLAYVVAYRGVRASGDPWDVWVSGCEGTADASLDAAGPTTTVPDTRVVIVAASGADTATPQFSAWSAPGLDGGAIGERADAFTTAGNGGGVAVADGTKAAPGSTGTISATLATAFAKAWVVIALAPAEVSSSGSLLMPALAATGSGTVGIAGTGSLALPALALAAASEVWVQAQGALSAPPMQLAATGDHGVIDGSGSLAMPALGASGTAEVQVDGSGALALPAFVSSGSGGVQVSASGTLALSALAATGSGTVGIAGTGSLALPALALAAASEVWVQAQGALSAPPMQLAATGDHGDQGEISGSGNLTLPVLGCAATGQVLVAGDGALVCPSVGGTGQGIVVVDATAALAHAAMRAEATGDVAASGAGAPALPAVILSGTGAVVVVGDGALMMPSMRVAGTSARQRQVPDLVIAGRRVRAPGRTAAVEGPTRVR